MVSLALLGSTINSNAQPAGAPTESILTKGPTSDFTLQSVTKYQNSGELISENLNSEAPIKYVALADNHDG